MPRPSSCDTFVAVPPATKGGAVIFGKNSDRPSDEVQEVIHVPAADHEAGAKVQCTYIEIPQVSHTYAVTLSKPAWMWGAEMGCNEHGVAIGNEAVWTKLNGPEDNKEKLLGMDLLRLALERSRSAPEALAVITELIGTQGQGGPCYEDPAPNPRSAYHNGFLIADGKEAWVLETLGTMWAAEHVTGLERAQTAAEGVKVLSSLLEQHGQGGSCSDGGGAWSYHNSFILCDPSEAWVFETAGSFWAAENVKKGVRNISNQLTIRTKIDQCSSNLREYAQSKGWWNPDEGDMDFAKVFADGFEETEVSEGERPCGRQQWGTHLLKEYSKEGMFGAGDMMRILRDEDSGICMTGGFLSTGSQVSVLSAGAPAIHWFTGTPNPAQSLFKPFVFCPGAGMGDITQSPDYGKDDPRLSKPRFQKKVDRAHKLWTAHDKLVQLLESSDADSSGRGSGILSQIRELESCCINDMDDAASNFDDKTAARLAQIFLHMAEIEMNFYK